LEKNWAHDADEKRTKAMKEEIKKKEALASRLEKAESRIDNRRSDSRSPSRIQKTTEPLLPPRPVSTSPEASPRQSANGQGEPPARRHRPHTAHPKSPRDPGNGGDH
jgi:hypothetical protein